MTTIQRGRTATYVGERLDPDAFLRPGAQVFVRSVDHEAGTAYVQSPWDSHERATVRLTELEAVAR